MVQRKQLRGVVARAAHSQKAETISQLSKNAWSVRVKEHLPAAPLPSNVVGKINIPGGIGFLQADDMAIFKVGCHLRHRRERETFNRDAVIGYGYG